MRDDWRTKQSPTVIINGEQWLPRSQVVKHLTPAQWEALEKAERPLYAGNSGAHAYTGVMGREDDDGFIATLWEICEDQMDAVGDLSTEGGHSLSTAVRMQRVAARVARVQAVIAFGPDFLLR